MMSVAKRLFGTRNERFIASLQPTVKKINELEPTYTAMSDDELKNQTVLFRERLEKGASLDSLLPEAFAVVREAAKRTLGERHYDVQLAGGMILHKGMISEMKTGEGKTLVATLASYLNALPGNGVHVVTVNDYLAKRDAEWMGQVHRSLGLTVGAIVNDMSDDARREAYACDITYATNNELGFDYLRDNMKFSSSEIVQRAHAYAIVDEVDSILIDEARTPLIISGPTEDRTDMYKAMNMVIPRLSKEDYHLDEKARSVSLTEEGMDHAEEIMRELGILSDGNLYDITNVTLVHHLNQALRAHTLFSKDKDYIIKDNQVVIIDEFTGRMMSGRRYSEGLHQALEAKENVDIKNENQTLASITFQNYFRMYGKLAGMTGTADTEAEELESIYGLRVVVVPTNRPVARADAPDIIYVNEKAKFRAIIRDIQDCVERGQPVLVGAASIEKSELLSEALKAEGIKHNVLNARYHEQEAEIIAQAGREGAITIATNMAGRGTDIKLGGNLELLLAGAESDADKAKVKEAYKAEKERVIAAGGLRVLGTERNESRRVDNQLRGRSGRQGDVGSSIFYISMEDDLMRIFAAPMQGLIDKMSFPEDDPIQSRMVSAAIETAQRKIEARNFDIRKNLLKYDDVLNDQRKVIYDQRREIMASETVDDILQNFRADIAEGIVNACMPEDSYAEQWLLEQLKDEVSRIFNVTPPLADWAHEEGITNEEMITRLTDYVERVFKEKEARFGTELMRRIEKSVLLQVLDQQWKDHLLRLDYLREGIHLRGYAQKNPLNEYKREAFVMFEGLLRHISEESVMLLSRVEVRENTFDPHALEGEVPAAPALGDPTDGTNPYADMDIGRNDPCPCGSGKRYKHCHGALSSAIGAEASK
ncbi:MAG: preprotein translocase subunit SecA [Proteobacteria bacterium]|nr:preprotein translocase subunit SecA [Pseudomonadota bacterium]